MSQSNPQSKADAGPSSWVPFVVGAVLSVVGAGGVLAMMANEGRVPRGSIWGALGIAVAVFGVLLLLRLPEMLGKGRPSDVRLFAKLAGDGVFSEPRHALPVAIVVGFAGLVVGGYALAPITLTAALLFLLPMASRRTGFLVFVVVSLLYLPLLGTYGLWDPWETHYGEVAREILARDDWISLWWAQEDWFWSKPILIFWSEALSMLAFGVDYLPDANPAHPEWAVRLPIVIMSIVALLAAYAALSRVFSKRAGVLGALVLATIPYYCMLAHQAITDMPFVSASIVAVSMLVLAFREQDPDREVTTYAIGPIRFTGQHVVIAAIVAAALPQILYLISRNLKLETSPLALVRQGDWFLFGSAGNDGVPGNAAHRDTFPVFTSGFAQPAAQAGYWFLGLLGVLWILRKERRAQSLYMFAFYVACGISFMGKGIPGFALPAMVALFYLIATRRWSLLFEGRLRVVAGVLTLAVVSAPWFVAMYVRHGPRFTDRLLVHDHINRLASGVHGDTGSIEYFLEQLGAGLFPWVALVPAAVGLLWWLQTRSAPDPTGRDPKRETLILLALWFCCGFALFSGMITKFHHYIFPVVPPAALLIGIMLDRAFGPAQGTARARWGTVIVMAAAVVAAAGVGSLWGNLRGVIPDVEMSMAQRTDWVIANPPWPAAVGRTIVVLACGLCVFGASLLRTTTTPVASWLRRLLWMGAAAGALASILGTVVLVAAALVTLIALHALLRSDSATEDPASRRALGAAFLVGVVVIALAGRDVAWATDARPYGTERLVQLFIYNYGRPWPDYLDFRPVFTGIAIVAGVILGFGAFVTTRPIAARAFVGLAIAASAWVVNVYMPDAAPHWTQRTVIQRYYELRDGPEEPLVAWQMNWKGENFYSGNRVASFVDTEDDKVQQWISAHEGTRTFFVLEHGRLGSLRRIVGRREVIERTTKRECNRFVLVEVML